MDLISFALRLRPVEQTQPDKPLPRWWGRAAHRLLLNTLKLNDEQLSESTHEGSDLRPFTTSTLLGDFSNGMLTLDADYLLRFTGLTQAVSETLNKAIDAGGVLEPGAVVSLDYVPFQIQGVHYEPLTHPLAAQTTYQTLATASLLDVEPAPRYVKFTFASPTTFHAHGKQVPYPMPEKVIGSLLERWITFSPIALPAEAKRYAQECLALSKFELKSRRVNVAGGVQVGMVGRVTFSTLNYDRYWMSIMQTLAQYAYYAGVGAKTGMGLGQCRQTLEQEVKLKKPLPV